MLFATRAMGTRFELVLVGGVLAERDLRAAGEAAVETIEAWDRRLSLFRRDSLVAHVNRTAAHAPVRLDQDTFDLLATCASVRRASGGAFDVGLAPRMRALGFHDHAHGQSSTSSGDVPGAEAIELDPQACTVRFRVRGVALDLGAAGKGHALDDAARVLRGAGVSAGLLHGGTSTVLGLGAPPDRPAWSVALAPGGTIHSTTGAPVVHLKDRALAVSGQHGRTLQTESGRTLGHVLDPRTGQPADGTGGAACAAVVADSALLADCWSTALLVLGSLPPAAAETHGIEAAAIGPSWRRLGPFSESLTFPAEQGCTV